ncbi:hypothetical protein PsYK624_073280 [Phanerochaete sordida]|uniref:SnoaL-like domain-containing protein n=1 Tax=Phanerochaete sordida TaxID=48140 RepID=A0A9P3LE23_9APHY|nr:hypothetical protein PsYK624_073280 [Phanerochaete sordida]
MSLSRSDLLAAAQALCDGFASKRPLPELLALFSTTHTISAHEYGEPFLAPFLGRTFVGRHGPGSVEAYVGLLQTHLDYEDMAFDSWIVDTEARKVSCRGRAKFTWTEGVGRGNWWHEQFAYHLDFDEDAKVVNYKVWSDSGAAYLASKGQLNAAREAFEKGN